MSSKGFAILHDRSFDPFSRAQVRLPMGRGTSSFCTSNQLHCALFVGALPLRSNSECPQLPLVLDKRTTHSLFRILQFSVWNTCPGGGKLLWHLVPLSWTLWNPLPCPIHSSLKPRQRSWGLSSMPLSGTVPLQKLKSRRNSENWKKKRRGLWRLAVSPPVRVGMSSNDSSILPNSQPSDKAHESVPWTSENENNLFGVWSKSTLHTRGWELLTSLPLGGFWTHGLIWVLYSAVSCCRLDSFHVSLFKTPFA